ncbi:hypothetical protein RHGRI_033280 [Rhododendron griersonianum]|uniref:ATP-dependent DNA helicase n=1 Tax=Rhododendron griersonianum TaxID=479676 RepID=A0AAV6HYQ1_9ERIC|nr:hypothetical protein RHGRI_033280 [Rhododendron griersonianum]
MVTQSLSHPRSIRPTSTGQIHPEDICSDDELNMPTGLGVPAPIQIDVRRHYLGKMDIECPHFKALHWMDERLARSTRSSPFFGTCCLQEKVRLHKLIPPPSPLQALYDGIDERSKSFRANSREYNAANAFTSLGAKFNPNILYGRGSTSFIIHGELRHQTGSLLPQQDQDICIIRSVVYLRSYICFKHPHLKKSAIEKRCASNYSRVFVANRRRYSLPTADEIVVVIPGDGTKASGMRDIILHLRGDNGLMQINECYPAYLPLHYVLLFQHGEFGWEPNLRQWDVHNDRLANERLTQMEYYSYRSFERLTEYSTILRAGKLFQEFLVDAWATTEQNQLIYYKLNQGPDKIRTCAQVDNLMCAEFPNPSDDPALFETVKCCMVHGPYGARNPKVVCMENGKCTKRYPQDFAESTTMDENGYPIYRRQHDNKVYIVRGQEVDNRDVIPHNPHLSRLFNYHINVEVCARMKCVKYIHKYIYKGHDRATIVLGVANEIQQYLDARYIGPPEAAWRIFGHHLHEESACVARGLLEDDEEWVQCLEEVAVIKTGYQLRRLFSDILTQCSPQQPMELWKRFCVHICDDLGHKIRTLFSISNPTEAQIKDYGLFLLNQLLQESGKSLLDFPPMQQPNANWSEVTSNRFIIEHQQLQIQAQRIDSQRNIERLNNGQRIAYDAILTSVLDNKGTTFFMSGGAGIRKTFVYNTVAKKCCSFGHIVVTVASSGIASLLLEGGRTAHSTFCIPLDVHDNSVCGFSKQSLQVELFRETKLIIWDEVPMQHKHCVEAVDRTLQDICDNEKKFGGIIVVLGGDFRQILPVVPKGVHEDIVNTSLRCSALWNDMRILTLDLNMRLNIACPGNATFANFLMELPSDIRKCQDLNEMLSAVYPQLNVLSTTTPTFLTERIILSARNDDVNSINGAALNVYPRSVYTYLAAIKMCEDDEIDGSITNRYPNEYLNSLDPPGLPPFKLELKVGSPIILLRNIAWKDGLCNGTRMMVVRCASRIIERRQFPVRLAYAMTINKSQGQSVKFVGIDLRIPVFSHGQLYVALSRCTSFDRISVLLSKDEMNTTTNIVYPEVLL